MSEVDVYSILFKFIKPETEPYEKNLSKKILIKEIIELLIKHLEKKNFGKYKKKEIELINGKREVYSMKDSGDYTLERISDGSKKLLIQVKVLKIF
jgi:hypothetical protein